MFFSECQSLLFVPRDEVLLQEVNVEFSSLFYSFSEWSNQFITNDFRPKHNITTPLLTPDTVRSWTLLAEPSLSPSIRSIECRTTLFGVQNCLKVYFNVSFCPIHPFFLVDTHPLMKGELPAFYIFHTSSSGTPADSNTSLLDLRGLRRGSLLD